MTHDSLIAALGQIDEPRATDDVLAMVLPLLEQVAALHQKELVAPLEGVDALSVTHGRIWFHNEKAAPPRLNPDEVKRLSTPAGGAIDVVGNFRVEESDTERTTHDLSVHDSDAPLERKAYLPHYRAWEHRVGHHDALSDIYVLGLIMGSVALDRSLADAEALSDFVRAREALHQHNARLHPVVAKAILQMTALDRHQRVQDLPSLVAVLKNYRDQSAQVFDWRTLKGLVAEQNDSRHAVICRHLRDRLFDFSRRNRLLHFQATGQAVNLTIASVPLVLQIESIKADTLLTWHAGTQDALLKGSSVMLGKYLRFEDYPYLPSALDKLRVDAARAQAEVGFSPLKLVPCFLHWHNFKENKEERITSPLLLLPAKLEKKKGVRDAYVLTVSGSEAEVNPVLRQHLKQLYDIDLPEAVDLSVDGAMESLFKALEEQITRSEPGVTIEKRERPQIDLVAQQARRRLEAFLRKARLSSSRSARTMFGFDYSYRGRELRPLGAQLFVAYVSPAAAPDQALLEGARPRLFPQMMSGDVVEKQQYHLRDAATTGGPYRWSFDLCSVTLGNFFDRKMSLVRDYAALLGGEVAKNPAFEQLFSPAARALPADVDALPLGELQEVIDADPSQRRAVARARSGESFIIQGPPGTGKSQTITNLVADAVARGKRVLFVCEKRAAIDVVYNRLQKQGLGELCVLVHDSQADKQDVIADLKRTYEGWLNSEITDQARNDRQRAVEQLVARLTRGESHLRAMLDPVDGAETQTLTALRRVTELGRVPPVDETTRAQLPVLRDLQAALPALRALERGLAETSSIKRFSEHPFRLLSPALLAGEPTIEGVRREARALRELLQKAATVPALATPTLPVRGLIDRRGFARSVLPLLAVGLVALLDAASDWARRMRQALSEIRAATDLAGEKTSAAEGWRDPLPRADLALALPSSRAYQSKLLLRLFGWLSPAWWRLRRVVRERYDFTKHAIRISAWQAIDLLAARYEAEEALAARRKTLAAELGTDDLEGAEAAFLHAHAASLSDEQRATRDALATATAEPVRRAIQDNLAQTAELEAKLTALLCWHEDLDVATLVTALEALERECVNLPRLLQPLRDLATAPVAVRSLPFTADELEAAVTAIACKNTLLARAADLPLSTQAMTDFTGALAADVKALRRSNAAAIVAAARARFHDNVRFSQGSVAGQPPEVKEKKRVYAAGRRDLEHEFQKTMRHKTIRTLLGSEAGAVIRDLKPVWLMSPLSVADTLPLEAVFDLVIFDEASQIPLEDAVPAIYRGPQCVVVGDEMQLPPTSFFEAQRDAGEDTVTYKELSETATYDLDAESLLNHAARSLAATMLEWHYRSRDEQLIHFSNRAFYRGRLLTVPSVARAKPLTPIVASKAEDGAVGAAALLERPLSFHRIGNGVYDERTNPAEASYIAHMVRALLQDSPGRTYGIVAFSEAQQTEIEAALARLGAEDEAFATRLEIEMEREEDGQYVGLFVKNLENVQGDERDVIIVSVCYAPDQKGQMRMNFGPINKNGGEKRLNVIFSRAKHHMAIVSTIDAAKITNDYNDGARCLKTYLRFAEASSKGDASAAQAALLDYDTAPPSTAAASQDPVAKALAQALRDNGYIVDLDVGASELRCQLAVRRPDDPRYRLAILLDSDHAERAVPAETRFSVRTGVLEGFGWNVCHVLAKDWFADRDGVLAELMRRIDV